MFASLSLAKRDFDAIAESSVSDCTISPEFSAAFVRKAVGVSCTSDEVLFRAGEPGTSVYLILSGEAGLLLPVSGTEGIGFHASTDSLLGLPAAFSNQPYSMSAIAWKGSELAVMSRDRFCDLIASDHSLAMEVLRILAAETRAARLAVVDARSKVQGETSR